MSDFQYSMRKGLGPDGRHVTDAWWCPACSILVEAVKNPVLCDECDGDMSIAPKSVLAQRVVQP